MAVDQPNIIDFIGVDKTTGAVMLTISDHLEWTDTENHQLILQEKINRYLAFIESGEIFESYSDSKGRHVAISIIGKHAPDSSGRQFLARVKSVVENAGFGFQFQLFSGSKNESHL